VRAGRGHRQEWSCWFCGGSSTAQNDARKVRPK
jgi:hypothetical protein